MKWSLKNFLFKSQSLYTVSLLRILIGSLCVFYGIELWPDRFIWFGDQGFAFRPLAEAWEPNAFQLLLVLPRNPLFLNLLFLTFIISSLSMALRFYERISNWMAFFCLLVIQNRNLQVMYGGDILLKELLFYLALAPSSNLREGEPWSLRLIQVQVSIVYIATSWWKLLGKLWINGDALYFSVNHHLYTKYFADEFTQHFEISRIATWVGLGIEMILGTVIWFPKYRKYIILLGLAFHLVLSFMMNIPYWQAIMMIGLLSFLSEKDSKVLLHKASFRGGRFFTRFLRVLNG